MPNLIQVPGLDLRSITRSDKFLTSVSFDSIEGVQGWILCGRANITANTSEGVHELRVPLRRGATDEDHSSSLALSLQLIGLQFRWMREGTSVFHAYVGTDASKDDRFGSFRIPPPNYDPFKGAETCTRCKPRHPLTEFLPPFDPEVFKAVAGKRVRIQVGPTP